MEPIELNAGRFYLRPLHNDQRINDEPACAQIGKDAAWVAAAHDNWLLDQTYTWAVCEQTRVEMVALIETDPLTGTVTATPVGDSQRVLPNDPVLPPVSVATACTAGVETVQRWLAATKD